MVLGIFLNVLAIFFAIFGICSNKAIKKSILKEKDLIASKILDIKAILEKHLEKVFNDRKTFNDPKRNEVHIRIEDIEGMIENLKRFANDLQKIK